MVPTDEIACDTEGRPLKAIMPAEISCDTRFNNTWKSKSPSMTSSEFFNEFIIDKTQMEKLVQDSDSVIMEQKYNLIYFKALNWV